MKKPRSGRERAWGDTRRATNPQIARAILGWHGMNGKATAIRRERSDPAPGRQATPAAGCHSAPWRS